MKLAMNKTSIIRCAGLIALVLALVALGLWRARADGLKLYESEPYLVMGTNTQLKAVATRQQADAAGKALADAEAALRRVEALMSAWLESSELSVINGGGEGSYPLSGELAEVLRASRAFYDQTGGAFDVTCRPIIELWKRAGEAGRLPTKQELAEARKSSNWDQITIKAGSDELVKARATACVDLGGIAKGYGIDKAVEAMMKATPAGGLVNVGGDIRCFGRPPGEPHWPVHVKNPFGDGMFATLAVRDAAVCTSGNYERYSQIGSERYSHIVDPREAGGYMALRASSTPASVTVIARTAMVADAWATALSVLGPSGMKLLKRRVGIEAMMVTGTPGNYNVLMTDGFKKFVTAISSPSQGAGGGAAGR